MAADAEYLTCASRPDTVDVRLIELAPPATNGMLLRHALSGQLLPRLPSLNGQPGTVRLPAGTFRIDGVDLVSGQRVVGASRRRTRLQLSGGVAFNIPDGSHGVRLSQIGIEATAGMIGVGVQVESADRITIEDVDFDGLGTALSVRQGDRPTSMIVVEGAAFRRCRWGVSAAARDSVTLLRLVACSFSVDRADQDGGGVMVSGQNVNVTSCRFEGAGVRGGWRPIDLNVSGAEIRYNTFDVPPPHIVREPVRPGEDGVIVEHNVHLQGSGDESMLASADPGVVRGAGQGQIDTGEGHYNLLTNASFEWWRELPCGPQPVGWRVEGQARLQRLDHVRRRTLPARGMYGRGVADPAVRDGHHALRVTVQPGRQVCVLADATSLPRAGPYTFSCWVRMATRPLGEPLPMVRLTARAGRICSVSETLPVGGSQAATWRRLACTVVASDSVQTLTLGIDVVARKDGQVISVDFDGAALHRGYFAKETHARVLTDAGGELLGPTAFAGRGALMTACLRVPVRPKTGDGIETIAVPVASQLESVTVSCMNRFTMAMSVNPWMERGRLPRAQRWVGGPIIQAAPGWRVNPREVLQVQVSRTQAKLIDVELRFRVPVHADRRTIGPMEPLP